MFNRNFNHEEDNKSEKFQKIDDEHDIISISDNSSVYQKKKVLNRKSSAQSLVDKNISSNLTN